jgi:hypothetical protein
MTENQLIAILDCSIYFYLFLKRKKGLPKLEALLWAVRDSNP